MNDEADASQQPDAFSFLNQRHVQWKQTRAFSILSYALLKVKVAEAYAEAETARADAAESHARAESKRATIAEHALGAACLAIYGYGQVAKRGQKSAEQRIAALAAEIAALKADERRRLFSRISRSMLVG